MPFIHQLCFLPIYTWFRHKVWQDLLQKNFLLKECLIWAGVFQIFFEQIQQCKKLPVVWPIYWHLLEQYLPQPIWRWCGLA
jgi:hypothetical protein